MAYTNFGIGCIIGAQSAYGTVNATIAGMVAGGGSGTAGALTTANGAVLGDAGSGIGESGIDFALGRKYRDLAAVSGSFTKQFSTFLLQEINKFTLTCQARGSGRAPVGAPVDGDCSLVSHFPGKDALYKSSGMLGADWTGGTGFRYAPSPSLPCTAKLWIGNGTDTFAVVLYNLFADYAYTADPGDVGIEVFDLKGSVYSSNATETFPTFEYLLQSSISSPIVELADHSWGAAGVLRGFESMSISISNSIEDVKDSNVIGGISKRQTDREITLDANVYLDSSAPEFDFDRLKATSVGSNSVIFTVARLAPVAASVPQLSYRFTIANPDHFTVEPTKIGGTNGSKITARATSASANTEMFLDFL